MQVRDAQMEDADEACLVIRRSITELCHCDHLRDASTLTMWLANKTGENMRRWIDQNHVIVAIEGKAIIGVAAIRNSGEIMLNYVSPDARFRGVSKALVARLETIASGLGLSAVTLQSSATARKFYLSAGYTEKGLPVKGFGATFGYPMAKQLSSRANAAVGS
jgi:GNAT superfamily N-acetyltransferase